jgi:hypothetical protein
MAGRKTRRIRRTRVENIKRTQRKPKIRGKRCLSKKEARGWVK